MLGELKIWILNLPTFICRLYIWTLCRESSIRDTGLETKWRWVSIEWIGKSSFSRFTFDSLWDQKFGFLFVFYFTFKSSFDSLSIHFWGFWYLQRISLSSGRWIKWMPLRIMKLSFFLVQDSWSLLTLEHFDHEKLLRFLKFERFTV